MERTRTIHWEDPMTGAAAAREMQGVDYLRAMQEGSIPASPIGATLDMRVTEIAPGKVTFVFEPQEFHYNPIGTVHGGVITAILDSAMGCTLHSMLPAGTGYTTLELKVNFLKAVTIRSGRLSATGRVIHSGSRTALVEAQLTDEHGVVYAHGTSTCMLLK